MASTILIQERFAESGDGVGKNAHARQEQSFPDYAQYYRTQRQSPRAGVGQQANRATTPKIRSVSPNPLPTSWLAT